jgi:hypothetical protein
LVCGQGKEFKEIKRNKKYFKIGKKCSKKSRKLVKKTPRLPQPSSLHHTHPLR